ncbi:MAG TPA: hypothetical protein VF135_08875 [Terriglobales bacterium]
MKKVDIVFAWLMVALGVLHCGAAWISIKGFPIGAIWGFAGGAAILEAGLLNLVRQGSGKGLARGGSILANVLLAIMIISLGLSQIGHLIHSLSFIVITVLVVVELVFSLKG